MRTFLYFDTIITDMIRYNPAHNAMRRDIEGHLGQYGALKSAQFEIIVEDAKRPARSPIPFYDVGIMPVGANVSRRINVSAQNIDGLVRAAEEILKERGHEFKVIERDTKTSNRT
jgi:hypothetical protein